MTDMKESDIMDKIIQLLVGKKCITSYYKSNKLNWNLEKKTSKNN
jgi:hypothetical protein